MRDGLKGRPSSGPVPLSDFMENPLPSSSFSARPPQPSSSYRQNPPHSGAHAARARIIAPGTVVQAKSISGEYIAAKIWGILPKIGGEHVVLVSYLDKPLDNEEVPLTMVKTLDKDEVTWSLRLNMFNAHGQMNLFLVPYWLSHKVCICTLVYYYAYLFSSLLCEFSNKLSIRSLTQRDPIC